VLYLLKTDLTPVVLKQIIQEATKKRHTYCEVVLKLPEKFWTILHLHKYNEIAVW
jgi:hypothetical protein